MASDTDTLPSGAGTAARPATSPPDTCPPARRRRGVLGWTAAAAALVAVTALAVAVFAGGDSDTPVAPFDPQVERYEREAHLAGQARTYGVDTSTDTSLPRSSAVKAERYEREAHLAGQARTHEVGGDSVVAHSPETSGEDSSSDEFVPGTRHMPMR